MSRLLTIVTLLLFSVISYGQSIFPFVYLDSIPVHGLSGDSLLQPWAGGFNNVQIEQLDVNFDCLPDLVFFEIESRQIKVYINQGDSGIVKFRFEEKFSKYFPQDLAHVAIFKDYNDDGLPDLLTYGRLGAGTTDFVRLYKNVSDSILQFELADNMLSADNVGFDWPLKGALTRVGDFEDVNFDGKPDIIIMDQTSITYNYNKNSSSTDSLELSLVDKCWGKFYESGDSIRLNHSCKGRSEDASRDATCGIQLKDFENDSLMDVMFSHKGSNSLIKLTNAGDVETAIFSEVEYNYPQNSTPVNMVDMPIPYFIDLDNSGQENMLVSPYVVGDDTANLWRYNPIEINGKLDYEFVENDFLAKDQLDFGTRAQPYFYDVNADGLMDIIVANMGYFDTIQVLPGNVTPTAQHISQLALLLNVGVVGNPEYKLQDLDYLNLSSFMETNILPAFGDLNNDGAEDLLLLSGERVLRYYQNSALPGLPANWVLHTDSILLPNLSNLSCPLLLDVNGDSLLDLIVTSRSGVNTELNVYVNHGSANSPLFNSLDIPNWGNLNLPFNYDYHYFDANINYFQNEGVSYLSVGGPLGYLRFYEIESTIDTGDLNLVDSIKLANAPFGVTLAKIDSVSPLALLVGRHSGGVNFYGLDSMLFFQSPFLDSVCDSLPSDPPGNEVGMSDLEMNSFLEVYPNPTNGQFNIAFAALGQQQVTLRVIDLGGKTLFTRTVSVSGNETISIQPSQLPKGMVLVEIDTEQGKFYKRLIIQ